MFSALPTASYASAPVRSRQGVPTARRGPSVTARRRVARLVALGAVAALGAIILSTRFADASEPNPGSKSTPTGMVPGGVVVIVQPGETLWSVARALQPLGDVRPLVARLARAHGGSGVQSGDRLNIPSDVIDGAPMAP